MPQTGIRDVGRRRMPIYEDSSSAAAYTCLDKTDGWKAGEGGPSGPLPESLSAATNKISSLIQKLVN
jgi:hypothetical protein